MDPMVGSGAVRNVVAPLVGARPHLTQTKQSGILSLKQPTNASLIHLSRLSLFLQDTITPVPNVPSVPIHQIRLPLSRFPHRGLQRSERPMSQMSHLKQKHGKVLKTLPLSPRKTENLRYVLPPRGAGKLTPQRSIQPSCG